MKLLSKEAKIGLVGVLSIIILYYGISFLKGANLFNSTSRYYVEFENISQLSKSSPVYADGYKIGIVSDLAYNYANSERVVVVLDLDPDIRIPKGSSAMIESSLMGNTSMHLLLANNFLERIEPGDTLHGTNNRGLMGAMNDMMPAIQNMLPKLDSILTGLNVLVNDPALRNTLHNAETLTDNLKTTTSKLDKVMDQLPEITGNLNKICYNTEALTGNLNEKVQQLDIEGTMSRVNKTLANVEDLTNKLNNPDGTIGKLLNDNQLYDNMNLTMNNAAILLQDFKAHPKRYVHFSVFGKKDK